LTGRLQWPLWTAAGLLGLAAALGACSPGPNATPVGVASSAPGTRPTSPPSATPYRTPTSPPPSGVGRPTAIPLPLESGRFFAASGVCIRCHTNQTDSAGQDVSIDTQWAVSSMANSARNPFWQAAVSAEVLSNPDQSQPIQAFCSTCHMPMAKYTANVFDTRAVVLGDGFLDPGNALNTLAMDGVSCTLCHQISQNGLGTDESYSGGFVIDAEAPPGSRPAFGPYETDSDLADLMGRESGFMPFKSIHITQSEVCATCHQVVLQLDGTPTQGAPLTLQATYIEWLNSDARFGQACQDCHMPEATGGAYVADQSRQPRSPFRQHSFLGGNVTLLQILLRHGSDLGVGYLEDLLPAAQASQREFMQSQAADVTIQGVRQIGARLEITVEVRAKTGHKFPTGFPSRRAWIHVRVQDSSGVVVFESGAVGPDGSVIGDDQALGTGSYEPHYRVIDTPDKVQIYEAVLGTAAGTPTTRLTEASRWLKDNRLLPAGYESDGDAATAAVGRASEDDDFTGGVDIIQYSAPAGGAPGPYTVTVALLYQSVTPAWIDALEGVPSAEADRYGGYMQALKPEALPVSEATTQFQP
jgi:hypothetical protein